jgi:hypothetical protein
MPGKRTPKENALCRTPQPKRDNPNKRGKKPTPTSIEPWLEALPDEPAEAYIDDHASQVARIKRNLGRPVKYQPFFCALLVDHLSKGMTFQSFGACVGADRATVYRWLKHEEFCDARKRGEASQEKTIVQMLQAVAHGQLTRTYDKTFMVEGLPIVQQVTEPTSGNASAAMYLAKNILGWKDKHDVTISGDPANPIVARTESTEEKLERLERLRKAREAVTNAE